jgi:predicted TIM-barrel fold metal-dependent hydrolase
MMLSMKLILSFLLIVITSCSSIIQPVSKDFATDVHVHIQANIPNEDVKFDAARALIAIESVDLRRALVLSNSYNPFTTKESAREKNEFVAAAMKKHPGVLSGACAVNPIRDWAIDEIKNCHKDGLRVLKLHTVASGMDLTKPEDQSTLRLIMAELKKHKMTLLVHGSFMNAYEAKCLLKTLMEYPDVRVIIGHGLGKDYDKLLDFNHPRFLVDVSGICIWTKTPAERRDYVAVMKKVGLEKYVFGSDWPVFHPAEIMSAVRKLPLTTTEADQIIFGNGKLLNDLF